MKTQITLMLETDAILSASALAEIIRSNAGLFLSRHGIGRVTRATGMEVQVEQLPEIETPTIPRIEGFQDDFSAFVCTIEVQRWGATCMATAGHGFPQVYGNSSVEAIQLAAKKIAVLIGMTCTELTYQPNGKAMVRFERDPA